MRTLKYHGIKVCDDYGLTVYRDAFDTLTGKSWYELVLKYAKKNIASWKLKTIDELESRFLSELFKYEELRDEYEITMETSEDKSDDEEDEETEELKEGLCVDIPDGNIKFNVERLEKPMYANTGCPVCDGRLKVTARSIGRKRMPNLYFSTCTMCGTNIGFAEDEEEFFPLTKE